MATKMQVYVVHVINVHRPEGLVGLTDGCMASEQGAGFSAETELQSGPYLSPSSCPLDALHLPSHTRSQLLGINLFIRAHLFH